ncbi:hypothetical protein R1sor_009027 [Riccia sorocarpa]|uniref:Uncharacterized protein n=1 Tax=Riccia sorocarpa TaxID=122646 RepID=A0ABD3H576_9MARC
MIWMLTNLVKGYKASIMLMNLHMQIQAVTSSKMQIKTTTPITKVHTGRIMLPETSKKTREHADYDTRTSPSRRCLVNAEDVADLERRRDRIWWDVDHLETKKMRMEMEMEDLEDALARADSSLQAASRKHQQVEKELNNKVRRKEEVEREIAEKEQFWERGHLNIEDSDFATKPVDADQYNSLLIHARQVEAMLKTFREGYLDPHVEVNRSNHDSAQGECSSRPGLFDGLLAAVQEAMESPSEEENSLGSLLAAIEQEAERQNSPPRHSQEETDVEPTDPVHSSRLHDDVEGIDIFVDLVLDRGSQKVPVPVHTDMLQPERIPQTFSCADQQLPVDSKDPRPKRIPAEVSSQQNDPPATSNGNSPGNPQPPSVGIGCLPNEQTAEVITVDNVPVTSNTSPESLHGGPTAQEEGNENMRKEKRKAATAALVEPSSPSKRVATSRTAWAEK